MVDLKETMFWMTLPGERRTTIPTNIPGAVRVAVTGTSLDWRNEGLTGEEGDDSLVDGAYAAHFEVIRDPKGKNQEQEDEEQRAGGPQFLHFRVERNHGRIGGDGRGQNRDSPAVGILAHIAVAPPPLALLLVALPLFRCRRLGL